MPDSTFLEIHKGSKGRTLIREIRWHPTEDDFVAFLKSLGFPDVKDYLPYNVHVYEVFQGKPIKKLSEKVLRERFFSESTKKEAKEDTTSSAGPHLTYGELLDIPDNAKVWVKYVDNEHGTIMNSVYKIRRSSSQKDVWYLEKKGKERETFVQDTKSRESFHFCTDLSLGLGVLQLFKVV
jgi:hypothetical protein